MARVRTFIAIELPEAVVAKLASLQDRLQGSGARVKWVNRDNLHLTLKFLGDVEYERVSEISQVIGGAVADITPFSVSVKGTGTFPRGSGAPRVVWAGLEGDTGQIEKMHSRLNEKLVRFGVPYEKRRFSPHITIGRVKSASGSRNLIADLQDFRTSDFGQVDVSELVFMMSELTGKGPIYTALSHIPFGNA